MMNKKSYLFFIIFFAFLDVSWLQADEIKPGDVLKKHYLSKFIDPTNTEGDILDSPELQEGESQLKRFPLSERMTPLRVRSILLHYLCPECSGRLQEQNSYPVHYHSDVWRDTQVFNTPGKAHLYDQAFPGKTLLRELYGAYLLVTGATFDVDELFRRQLLIRQIQERGLKNEMGETLTELDKYLSRGVAIFDRMHPFNNLLDMGLYNEEQKLVDWFDSTYRSVKGQIDEDDYTDNAARNSIVGNLNGGCTREFVRLTYGGGFVAVIMGGLGYKMTGQARALTLRPWYGCKNCIYNGVNSVARLGGYSNMILTPIAVTRSMATLYQSHWRYKNTNKILTQELIALKPFLEALFSFRDVYGLPLLDFSLSGNDQLFIDSLLEKIDRLSDYDGHWFQGNLYEAASATRMLLLLRETIVRYLNNIAKLDFYISVAEGIKGSGKWSYAIYDALGFGQVQPQPRLVAKGLWNPMLSPRQAVASDISLGKSNPASVVLTGANASGKSTFLRGLGINAIFMAQTLGIVAAEKFELRPFTHFDSLMEKRDKQGRSSYETEVESVIQAWAFNRELPEGHRSLIIADELFRTTNAREGAAASKLLTQKLGNLPHTALLVSTHFKSMRQLAIEQPKVFANKHMSVEMDEDTGEITKMHYRLVGGASPSSNAIQMFDRKFRKEHPEFFQD